MIVPFGIFKECIPLNRLNEILYNNIIRQIHEDLEIGEPANCISVQEAG